jgi:fibronectin type 3 domain-containing protein
MHPGQRVVAAAAGIAAALTSTSGTLLALAPPAVAEAAPGQDVDNDWGQSAAEVDQEIAVDADADPVVLAARARYQRALASYHVAKKAERAARAARRHALATTTHADDGVAARALAAAQRRVHRAANEVVAAQLSMANAESDAQTRIRGEHYVQAPRVALPAQPTGLIARGGSAQVALSWGAATGAAQYRVFRDGTQVASTTAATYLDVGLDDSTTYAYRVLAVNVAGWSPVSDEVVATTAAATPAAPTGLVAAAGDTTIQLSWASTANATGYHLYRGGTLIGSPTGTTFTDTGLSDGTSYSYTVSATNGTAESTRSTAATATPVATPPPAPTGLVAVPGDRTVNLTWNQDGDASSYRVYRGTTLVGSPTSTSFTDTGLSNGISYPYTVVAFRLNSVASPASAAVTATPTAAAPGAPTGLSAQAGDTVTTLSWAAVSGATSYKVYRGGVLRATVSTTTWTDTGLTNGTTYSYYVTAVKVAVESAPSATVTAAPAAVVPATPTGLTATPGNTQVTLTWTATSGATGYRIYRGGVLIASPTTTTYTDTGRTNGTTYSYYVIAVNGSTPSPASTTVTATPFAPAVSGTFTGATTAIANGHGTLNVVIVLSAGKITSATGTLLTYDSSETRTINSTAIPQYNSKAVAANSASISKVTGATLTWAAYKTSLQSALTQAGL